MSGIIGNGDRIQQFYYQMTDIYILIGGESIAIPVSQVKELKYVHDYISNIYPIISLQLTLASDTYYKILENKNDLQIHFRMDKLFKYLDLYTRVDRVGRSYINETYDIILDEATDNLNIEVAKEESMDDYQNIKKDNSKDSDKINNEITFYLFSHLDEMNGIVNKIISKATVTDAINYLASQAQVTNIVMQNVENTTVYDYIFIPELSTLKALKFIDVYYGIYSTGSTIYKEDNTLYILPFKQEVTAFDRSSFETTTLIVPKNANSELKETSGVLKKRNGGSSNSYLICDYTKVNVENGSISNDFINGTDVDVTDSYTGATTDVKAEANTKTDNHTVVTVDNNTENQFIGTMNTAQAESLSNVITVTISDIDASLIKLNKNYTFIFENTEYADKYKGEYMITGVSHDFLRAGEEFLCTSKMVFRKLENKQ